MSKRRNGNGRRRVNGGSVIWAIITLAVFAGGFLAGYGIMSLLYLATGEPPEIIRHLLSCTVGFVIIMPVLKIVIELARRLGGKKNGKGKFPHQGLFDDIQNALASIARGNFDVFVADGDDVFGPLSDMVESINQTAAKLGTAESIRQNFVSNVSHEIQSPITSIGGFAELMKSDGLSAETRSHYIEIIEAECKRLSNLSNNLLKLSALDGSAVPLKKETFRLDKQIKQAAIMLEPQWTKKNLTLEADIERAEFTGDEALLYEVWVNLINNAVKFTPESGRIDIALRAQADGGLEITVADNGIGISPEAQTHIFERFYKADASRNRDRGGSGLGLSLVKKIIDLHGGRIEFTSECGKGTTFKIFLPH